MRYFFFRHKSPKDKAFRLSLYSVANFRKLATITPGFGGNFEWNDLNQIIHGWGCGTNCSNLRVYNLKLNELFYTLSSGGFILSPKKDIVIQIDMFGNRFWIYDLKTIDKNGVRGVSEIIEPDSTRFIDSYDIWSLTFKDDYKFEIYPKNSSSLKKLTYNIETLNFSIIDPDNIGEYYFKDE